ncbi:MAG: heme-binding protein [Cyanobacteria bacterium J06641_5]
MMNRFPQVALALTAGLLLGAIAFIPEDNAMATPLPQGFPAPTAPDRIEVKTYPTYRGATVRQNGDLAAATQLAFGPLFQHISSNDIGMTAPVEARYPATLLTETENSRQGEAEVSFLYENPTVNPSRVAPNVTVADTPSMTVVSLGQQGSYDYSTFEAGIARLRQWLAEHPEYNIVGAPRRLLYDGPFTPAAFKRSEIQVPIAPVNP